MNTLESCLSNVPGTPDGVPEYIRRIRAFSDVIATESREVVIDSGLYTTHILSRANSLLSDPSSVPAVAILLHIQGDNLSPIVLCPMYLLQGDYSAHLQMKLCYQSIKKVVSYIECVYVLRCVYYGVLT